MERKLKNFFADMVVYKDMKHNNFFSALSLPSFMRDWLLTRHEDEDGKFDAAEISEFVRRFIPRKDDWKTIKSRIVMESERVRLLAKISIDIDVATGAASFSLPDFGLQSKETMIDDVTWSRYKIQLKRMPKE